jgi:hypothetical protein
MHVRSLVWPEFCCGQSPGVAWADPAHNTRANSRRTTFDPAEVQAPGQFGEQWIRRIGAVIGVAMGRIGNCVLLWVLPP